MCAIVYLVNDALGHRSKRETTVILLLICNEYSMIRDMTVREVGYPEERIVLYSSFD